MRGNNGGDMLQWIAGLTTAGQMAEDGAEGEDVGGGTTACKV